jgi:NAD-reducing hydrogenase small subunit
MSLLDIDERILELAEMVEFDRSPVNDIKSLSGPVDIGLIEGGCCNEENVRILQDFRRQCRVLVSIGDCAINGGVPAMRNMVPLGECYREAFIEGPSVFNPDGGIPGDDEIPLLLDRVYPCQDVVEIDYFLPGCPPAADALWDALTALLAGRKPELSYELIRYD